MLIRRLYWTAYLAFASRGQGRYAFKPLAAIRRDQARRVRRMVAYAYRHVPYYRETMDRLGLVPSDVQTAAELAKLPVVEREDLQRGRERFLSDAVRRDRTVCLQSGGSSGAPTEIHNNARHFFQLAAYSERHRSLVTALVGKRHGYRETTIYLLGGSADLSRNFLRANTVLPAGFPSRTQHLSVLEPPAKNVERMNEFKPDVLYTYGSYLEMLFAYLAAAKPACHLPKVIAYGADGLSRSVRRLILDEYRIPLFSAYGANEAVRIAFECEQHRGLHVNLDIHPVRIVDAEGRDLPAGTPGDVVVSNLLNRATVLLNYRLGDIAALLPAPCACGRSLPLMSFPYGRCDDFVTLPSGEIINPTVADELLGRYEEIWQYQIVQEAPARFKVRVVAREGCDREGLRRGIGAQFAATLREAVDVEVCFVEAIERTAGGKRRSFVSLLDGAQRHPAQYAPDAG